MDEPAQCVPPQPVRTKRVVQAWRGQNRVVVLSRRVLQSQHRGETGRQAHEYYQHGPYRGRLIPEEAAEAEYPGTAAVGEVRSPTVRVHHLRSNIHLHHRPVIADSRVYHPVQKVHHQVHDGDGEGVEQHDSHDEAVVTLEDSQDE